MSTLKYSDVFCYICRGILIEPVTLPCFHVFCLSCFEQSMQETSYSCPLCRKRISNWVRSVKKSNNLVNVELWTKIKDQYKEQVRLKLNGEDDGLDQRLQEDYAAYVSTSKPGELAQEFSKFFSDFKRELEKLKEAEELASKEYIRKLQEEEEQQIQLLQESNVTRIQEDAVLAMKIQEEINKTASTPNVLESSKKSCRRKGKKSNKKNTSSSKGPMDNFIKGYMSGENVKENDASLLEESKERSKSTDSTDSIRLEMNLFKPIKKVRKTPPKQYPDGRIREISLTKVTPVKLTFNNLGPSSSSGGIVEGKKIHSTHSAFVDTNTVSQETKDDYSSPSKRLRHGVESTESTVLKDITLGENADSDPGVVAQDDLIKEKLGLVKKTSQLTKFDVEGTETSDSFETQDYIYPEPSIAEKIIEEQRRIESMIMQEKEDRELALKLSREWEIQTKDRPQTRSMRASVKSTKNVSNKLQQTLLESMSRGTRSRKK